MLQADGARNLGGARVLRLGGPRNVEAIPEVPLPPALDTD